MTMLFLDHGTPSQAKASHPAPRPFQGGTLAIGEALSLVGRRRNRYTP
jgi:hypothetical protein